MMISNWMRFVIALMIVPFCFLTEYFLAAKFLHLISVSYWWLIYTILADTGNCAFIKKVFFGKDTK
jgi:hypothetical protein